MKISNNSLLALAIGAPFHYNWYFQQTNFYF